MRRRPGEDRATFVERLYDEHGASLFRYALMLLSDHAAAEDVLQHVFTGLLRRSGSLENPAHYLRRAVRNACYSTLRERRAHPAGEQPLLEPVTLEMVSPEERILLERALVLLPPNQREVIHLHVFEGLTFQEIADATAESINTVASRYRYAILKLRSDLA